MSWNTSEMIKRIGLSTQDKASLSSGVVTLAGGGADPQTGQIISLTSDTTFDDKGHLTDLRLDYWRHMPYGDSKRMSPFRIRLSPVQGQRHQVELEEIWVQSHKVFDRARGDNPDDPETKKKINRVLEGINRLNTLLREKGKVEDTAKILNDCFIADVTGEELVIRGLDKEKGGFDLALTSIFMKTAAQGRNGALEFRGMDSHMLKTLLGFRINTLEPDKDFSGSRSVRSTDPKSGVDYESGVKLKETTKKLTLEMYLKPIDPPSDIGAMGIPDLLKFEFEKKDEDTYVLKEATFLGQTVQQNDMQALLSVIGVAQKANRDFADWKYPAFMDSTAEFNLLDMVDPLHRPPSLEKEGGEFLYTSLHGCGFEKVIENFGDQIGIAALFLNRGLKADGKESTVGLAVDFPFAAGGPNSNYDGAVPDYLPFWDKINAFAITHDHFDHKGGLPYYALKGLMRNKTVYCTDRVKYMLDKDMESMKVPRNLRPKIVTVETEGAFPITDEDGVVRMWVQHHPNATDHSALCTPYIVTSCYGDNHYKGSALVYGDSRGLKESAHDFFKQGTRKLPEQAKIWGETVTPEKVDRDITVTLHDVTAYLNDGTSPEPREVEENLVQVMGLFKDKGMLMCPISTNNAEYTVGMNLAHRTGRNVTGVGRNAELRLSSMNLFGVLPDFDLRSVRIDPLIERQLPEFERVIPEDVLETYFSVALHTYQEKDEDDDEFAKRLAKEYDKAEKELFERLPPDERDHESSTKEYMLDSLKKHGAVVFENDLNGYLMWKAVTDRKEKASMRATRTSAMAKSFRADPSSLMIFITGTQGNSEEEFSTMQKFANFFSLLDTDDHVRNTGYKINGEDYIAVITQPPIPGNEESQELLIREIVRNRDITVIGAYLNGFKIYNPKEKRAEILEQMNRLGWKSQIDTEGNIRVYGHPIHVHGHGFRQDVHDMAKIIGTRLHEAHHIPSYDAYEAFREGMKEKGFRHSGIKPDDFQFMRIDANQKDEAKAFEKVAMINPSYILVRTVRKYGQFYGGYLEWVRATMLRRDGQSRDNGLMVRSSNDKVYERVTAQQDFELVSNPKKHHSQRYEKAGPSIVDRDDADRRPRSRPAWGALFDLDPHKLKAA